MTDQERANAVVLKLARLFGPSVASCCLDGTTAQDIIAAALTAAKVEDQPRVTEMFTFHNLSFEERTTASLQRLEEAVARLLERDTR